MHAAGDLQAKERIAATYDELATTLARSSVTLSEKKSRVETFVGGLSAILAAGVCHGDLKPQNILWDETSFRISDFTGSISIKDVCAKMNREFRFESEEEKNIIKEIVFSLCEPNPRSIVLNDKEPIHKLFKWKILTKSSMGDIMCDRKKLQILREYLITKCLPDMSKGYASVSCRNAMGDYFWRCEPEKFRLACQALDIRAAGLTIYAILTGCCPPNDETDEQYYEQLERSLTALKLSTKAVSIINKMAKPSTLPAVTQKELKVLQGEFCEVVAIEEPFKRLQIAEPDHVIEALINGAFKAYPDACENTTTLNGQIYTTVFLHNPDKPNDYDVLIKKEAIGEGQSHVAYKALSLCSRKYVVIKYSHEHTIPQEAQNANALLLQIGEHEGVQKRAQLYRLQRNEDYKQIVVEPFYKNRDYASAVFGDLLIVKLNLDSDSRDCVDLASSTAESRLNPSKEREAIKRVFQKIQPKKMDQLQGFIDEYVNPLIGILGEKKVAQLISDYKTLIEAEIEL